MTPRAPKKTEMLEVRLSHEAKTAFMARCQAKGMTASEAVRQFIDGERPERKPRRSRGWAALAAALAGLALGAAAAPSLAQAGDDDAAFRRLDGNADGVLSVEEFARR